MRCSHCKNRNTWDCEELYLPDNVYCDLFSLDYESLSGKQKKEIQKRLMGKSGKATVRSDNNDY